MAGAKNGKADARVAALAEAMLEKLRTLRESGGTEYPLTLTHLAELAAPDARAPQVLAAAKKRTFSAKAVVVKSGKVDAPVALVEDLELLAASPLTLEFALRSMRTPALQARTVADLGNWMTSTAKFGDVFKRVMKEQMDREQTPPSVAWIVDRRPKLFLLAEIHPQRLRTPWISSGDGEVAADRQPPVAVPRAAPSPAEAGQDFCARFEQVFDALDRQKGSHNFVSLVDLRRVLPGIARAEFDAGLHQLRAAGRFSLSAAESIHGIRPEEREAGIQEAGTLLVYVSRKSR